MSAKAELRKFDAEIIRNLGYVLCTPFCLQILGFFLSQEDTIHLFKTPLAFTVLLFGLRCIRQSYDITEKGLKMIEEIKNLTNNDIMMLVLILFTIAYSYHQLVITPIKRLEKLDSKSN